jgi:hypothetical protein
MVSEQKMKLHNIVNLESVNFFVLKPSCYFFFSTSSIAYISFGYETLEETNKYGLDLFRMRSYCSPFANKA